MAVARDLDPAERQVGLEPGGVVDVDILGTSSGCRAGERPVRPLLAVTVPSQLALPRWRVDPGQPVRPRRPGPFADHHWCRWNGMRYKRIR